MRIKAVEAGLVILLAVYMGWLCRNDQAADVSVDTIEQVMLRDTSVEELEKGDRNAVRRFYGLDGSRYDGFLFYKAASAMEVDELLIVKVKTEDQLSELEESIEERVETQKNSFEGYGAEQTALLNQYIETTKGNYIFFAVSEQAGDWQEKFLACIEDKR